MTTVSLSERGRFMADLLAGLFEHDRDLAGQLDAARRRLQDANDRVCGEIAETIHRALAENADAIHRALVDYQSLAEQRRRLGADVGEAAVGLIDAMREAGFSDDQARRADVRALRDGVYQPASSGSGCSLTDFGPAREHGR